MSAYSDEDEEDGMSVQTIALMQQTYDLKEQLKMEKELKKFYLALAKFNANTKKKSSSSTIIILMKMKN